MRTLTETIEIVTNLVKEIEDLRERIEALEKGKVRGPKVDRSMTEADAFMVKFGPLKDASNKEAAAATGLSYGQVFSCRQGYTFKRVKADWRPKEDKK